MKKTTNYKLQTSLNKTLLLLLLTSFNLIFSQVPCQEIFFQSPYTNTLTNRNEISMVPERVTTIINNPDLSTYKDLFPNKDYVYNIIFKVIRDDNGLRQTGDIDLYNKLLEEYYYILKKYTSSGAEYNATFYKQ